METKLKHPVFYKHVRQLLLMVIAFFCVGGIRVFANDILVSNVRLTRPEEGGSTIVHFNLSWKNSFRVDDNWDAAWVFVKYRKQDGSGWKHGFLSNEGHTMPSGAQCDVGLLSTLDEYDAVKNPVLGTFIYRTSGGGDFNLRNVQLKWNYADNELVDIKVFAIEMVYIPQGEFLLGSGGTEVGSFTNGSWVSGNSIPFKVVNELKKPVAQKLDSLWGTAGSGTGPGFIQDPSSPSKVIPCAFPKGYSSFYCMKYEVTEGQYIDFLSTLKTSDLDEYLGSGDFNQSRNSISRAKIDEDSLRGFDKYLPYCGLHWGNFYAFLNWSGLRPMTEFEYEKICRGTLPAVPNEYAWGSTFILQSMGIDKPFTDAETSYNNGNCRYNSGSPSLVCPSGMVGPLRVGANANSATNRVSSGASYYGVQDMSGNGNEWAISAATGRKFKGDHGKGKVAEDKSLSWPTKAKPDGAGTRGGSFETVDERILRTSDRTYANGVSPYEFSRSGRGVRTAEPGYIIPEIKDTVLTICCDAEAVYEPLDERDGRVPNGTKYTWSIPQLPDCIPGVAISGKKDTKFKSGALQNSCDSIVKVIYHVIPDITDCEGDTFTVTVNVNPKPEINNFTATICSGGSVAITPVNITDGRVPKGTLYSWSVPIAPGITGFTSGSREASFTSGNLINNTNSPIDVIYTVTPDFNRCNGTPFTVKITVNPLGQVDLPANQTVCKDNLTTINFSTSNTGGATTYSWKNSNKDIGLDAEGTGNTISFTATNSGTTPAKAIITVTPTFTNGDVSCVGLPQSFTVTVNPLGQVSQPYSQIVCAGSSTAAIKFSTPNSGGATYYNWTINNAGIGLGDGSNNYYEDIPSFIAINNGTTSITATITVTPIFSSGGVECSGPVKYFSITVNPKAQVNQPANQVVCNQGTTAVVNFETTNSGGTIVYNWTNDTPSIGLALSGTGNIAAFKSVNTGTAPVVATIVVTPTFTSNGKSCSGTAKTFTITVNPTAVVTQPASQTICNGAGTTVVNFDTTNSGGTMTYNWVNSTPSIGLAANGTGNIASFNAVNNGASPVTATITVTPSFTNGSINCSGAYKTFTITVNPTAQVNAPANQVVCNGSNTTLVSFNTDRSVGTTTYSWTNSNTAINLGPSGNGNIPSFIATNTGASPITATITVTPTFTNNGVSCSGPVKTFTIIVNPSAQVNQPINLISCNGSNSSAVVFTTANTVGTTSYSWTNSNTSIGLGASGTGNLPAFPAANTGTSLATATITVTPILTNNGVSCSGPVKTFTITVYPSGQVNKPSNLTLNNGSISSAIAFTTANTAGGTTYSWSNNNTSIGLGSGEIGNVPTFAATNAGKSPATATITVMPVFTIVPLSCPGSAETFTITINPSAQVDQPSNLTLCNGSNSTAVVFTTANTVGTTTYSWTNSNTSIGLGASGTGNLPVFAAANTGTVPVTATITVTPTFTNNGVSCSGPVKIFTITVNPSAQVDQPSNLTLCNGSTSSVVAFTTANTVGTTSYFWVNSNTSIGLGASGFGNMPTFTAANTGTAPATATITVTPIFTNNGVNCSGLVKAFTITVNPTAQVDQPSDVTLNKGSTSSVIAFTTANTVGTTSYSWTNSNTSIGLGASGTGNLPAFLAANVGTSPVTATITVTPILTNNGVSCSGPVKTFAITVSNKLAVNCLLDCAHATNNGTLTAYTTYTTASGVNSVISYTDGDGSSYIEQVLNSSGVTGLTATLSAGVFSNDVGNLNFSITGTPNSSGTASFTINIGGQTCILNINVLSPGLKWFTNSVWAISNLSWIDGLSNTKRILKHQYGGYYIDINTNGMPPDINASNYAGIKIPVGAVEYCMRMNYNDNGILKDGINASNMWYLPAIEELKMLFLKRTCEGINDVFSYWSSTEFDASNSWYFNLYNHSTELTDKSTLVKVRCLRKL